MELEGFAETGSPEAGLLKLIDKDRLPKHVAVIMDGNGRWAGMRKLPRVAGHRAGIESVRDIVESSARLGLQVLTLYAFSVENWKRPRKEIRTLMNLLKEYLRLRAEECPQEQYPVPGNRPDPGTGRIGARRTAAGNADHQGKYRHDSQRRTELQRPRGTCRHIQPALAGNQTERTQTLRSARS